MAEIDAALADLTRYPHTVASRDRQVLIPEALLAALQAERAELNADLDRARGIAVALEQDLAEIRRYITLCGISGAPDDVKSLLDLVYGPVPE